MHSVISYLDRLQWINIDGVDYANNESYIYRRVRAGRTRSAWRYYFAPRDAMMGRWDLASPPAIVGWQEPSWQVNGWRPVRWSESAWCYRLRGCSAAVIEEIMRGRPVYTLIASATGSKVWGSLCWHVLTEAITAALAASSPNDDDTKPCAMVPGL
jgi:hypothetical protein